MARFIEGCDRRQHLLFPDRIEDYVGPDNPARIIDAFVDEIDLTTLGFADAAETGRPGYHPGTMLRLYLYGYLNQVQSSRRLEREAGRNVELMWLVGKLAPDFKTIADFRRDNGPAIRATCSRFVVFCRQVGLIGGGTVAVDGSRMKAVNTRDRNFTPGAIRRRIEQVDASIARYLDKLETADRRDDELADARIERLTDRIDALRRQMRDLHRMAKQVAAAPDGQISLTDPDARAMATNGKGTGMVGYNTQVAVDADSHLVVAHEVTNVGHDRAQLVNMGRQAMAVIGVEELTLLADRGYFSGPEILECGKHGIVPICPRPLTSTAKAEGRFGKSDFLYQPEADTYLCPAGQTLGRRSNSIEGGLMLHRYWTTGCGECALKPDCTPGSERRVRRWEHEDVIDAMQDRLDRMPQAMRIRRRTVEHVFGTIKDWMGRSHFKMRRLHNVNTEMSLHVLAYNIRRVVSIMGVRGALQALRA